MKIRWFAPILLGALLPAAGVLLRSEGGTPCRFRPVRRAVETTAAAPFEEPALSDPEPAKECADLVPIDFDRLEGIPREEFLAVALSGSEDERVASTYAMSQSARDNLRGEVLGRLEQAYRLDASERVRGEALDAIVGFADAGDARAQEALVRILGVYRPFDPEIERALMNLEDDPRTRP